MHMLRPRNTASPASNPVSRNVSERVLDDGIEECRSVDLFYVRIEKNRFGYDGYSQHYYAPWLSEQVTKQERW